MRDFDALLVCEFGEIVDKLPRVGATGDDETEFEVVGTDHFAPEVVPFNHLHLINWLGTVGKVQGQSDCPQEEEVRAEMILDNASRGIVFIAESAILTVVDFIIFYLNQSVAGDYVPNFEPSKFKLSPVIRKFAQEFLRWLLQILDYFRGDLIIAESS